MERDGLDHLKKTLFGFFVIPTPNCVVEHRTFFQHSLWVHFMIWFKSGVVVQVGSCEKLDRSSPPCRLVPLRNQCCGRSDRRSSGSSRRRSCIWSRWHLWHWPHGPRGSVCSRCHCCVSSWITRRTVLSCVGCKRAQVKSWGPVL